MALQNIGAGNKDDAFYRYKMPRMVTKIEGRGNGIKTNVVNMVDIAKALARPASYTTKYFGCELGAQSKFDEKTGVSLVNGAHETAKLAGLLENFIKKYVQCYGCGNPETDVVVAKNQLIQLKCAACGYLSDVDMRDKLTTFIVKNPPKAVKEKKVLRRAEKERMKEGDAADEEQKKIKKELKKKSAPSVHKNSAPIKAEDGGDSEGEEEVQWQTDTSAEAARQRIQEQLNEVTAAMVILDVEKEKDPFDELVEKARTGIGAGDVKGWLEAAGGGSVEEKVRAVVVALFGVCGKGFTKAVVENRDLLVAVVEYGGGGVGLLHALEVFFDDEGRGKEVAVVLKALYDLDVVEEESIVTWYDVGVSGDRRESRVWKNSRPFMDWLRSAESESE